MYGSLPLERIADLLSPFVPRNSLSDHHIRAISSYLELLLKWNAKINLTAIRDPEQIVTRHFGESLFAAQQLFPAQDSTETAIDLGSGAGFPGLPLKLWVPDLDMTLIESNQRKATFLREVVRALDLNSVSVTSERAEKLAVRSDLVTLRAVERFEQILPAAASLVKPSGRMAMLIGSVQVEAAHSMLPKIHWQSPIPIPHSRNRVLLAGRAQ